MIPIDGTSQTPTQEKLKALKQLMPEVFAEEKIDWEKLKATLGEDINFSNERYVLNWAGKSDAFKVLQTPTTKTLIPCPEESVKADGTTYQNGESFQILESNNPTNPNSDNIFIEGENMEVLKVLQKSYFGKVKMIYIDPPYNTGNDSFIYPDKFSETKAEYEKRVGDKDEEGYMTKSNFRNSPPLEGQGWSKNSKENGQYHSNWLNMMMPRLYLAKNLLRQDGVIFVSIDDNEVHNLRLLMNEIFGEENFVIEIIWANNERGRSIDKFISNTNEYILVFSKNIDELKTNEKKEIGNELLEQYSLNDGISQYKKGDPLYNNNSSFNIETRPTLVYTIYVNKVTNEKKCIDEKIKLENGNWHLPLDNYLGDEWIKVIPPLRNTNNKIGCWRWSVSKFMAENETELIFKLENNGNYMFYSKNRLDDENAKYSKFKNILTNLSGASGTTELVNILEDKIFNHPKPTKLIKLLLEIGSNPNDLILDFFAGSGTTAHAVMELNKEDGGNRKYICVQLPELCDEKSEAYKAGYKTIAEISKERIRRAGAKIKSELGLKGLRDDRIKKESKENQSQLFDNNEILKSQNPKNHGSDTGFKVLKLADSNFKQWQQFPSGGGVPNGRGGKEDQAQALTEQMQLFIDPVAENATIENMVYEFLLKSGKDLNSKIEKIFPFTDKDSDMMEKFPSRGGVAESRGGRNAKNYFDLPFNPLLKERAKELRQAGNLSEVLFWNQVKNKQFKGFDFDRQKIVGNYIVDFYCSNCNVVIEIDGSSHNDKVEYDAERDAFLESLGLKVIHIPVVDVMKNMNSLMEMLHNHPALKGTPPPEGNYSAEMETFYNINDSELILLLENVSETIIEQVVAEKPMKVIALDKLFKDNDQLKTNTVLQMRDAGIEFKTV